MHTPHPLSHKGQNGKVMIVGGSELFHAASQWSFQAISRWVDMTFYSSVAENNELLRDAKFFGHDGVIVPRSEMTAYMEEVDAVLIGPGMRRDQPTRFSDSELDTLDPSDLLPSDWESDTRAVVAALLHAFPHKQWVIDAGALQVLDPRWLPPRAILTPHQTEFRSLMKRAGMAGEVAEQILHLQQKLADEYVHEDSAPASLVETFSVVPPIHFRDSTIVLKGAVDLIWNTHQVIGVRGGNAGLTKGGTGDVLAGLIAAFAAKTDPWESAVTASWLNKQAAHDLYLKQEFMYNSSDLVQQIPLTWKQRTYVI